MRSMDAGRGREVTSEGRTTRDCQVPGRSPRAEKGGKTDEGHRNQRHAAQEYKVQVGPGQKVEDVKGSNRRD